MEFKAQHSFAIWADGSVQANEDVVLFSSCSAGDPQATLPLLGGLYPARSQTGYTRSQL